MIKSYIYDFKNTAFLLAKEHFKIKALGGNSLLNCLNAPSICFQRLWRKEIGAQVLRVRPVAST